MNSAQFKAAWLAVLPLLLFGLGGCQSSVQEVCSRDLPEFEGALMEFSARLDRERSGRTLAVSEESQWTLWAEAKIVSVQKWIDTVEPHKDLVPLRAQINSVANELVAFYGYAQTRDGLRMSHSLERLQQQTEDLKRTLCAEKISFLQY